MANKPLPIDDIDNITKSSDDLKLRAALAILAHQYGQGLVGEVTLEELLRILQGFNDLFNTADQTAEKLDKKQEEDRKKLQEEVSKALAIYRQTVRQLETQTFDIREIIDSIQLHIQPEKALDIAQEIAAELEQDHIKGLK